MTVRWIVLALGLFAFASGAAAGEFGVGDLVVEQPWARATPGKGKTGAAYLTLSNHGATADRLLAVATPIAKRAELHGHMMDAGVMKMRPVTAIEVAPGTPTVLQPGGLHVMLMGLRAPLKEGDRFPLTLTFEGAGSVEVQVDVAGVGAMGPAGHGEMHGHGHGQVPTN